MGLGQFVAKKILFQLEAETAHKIAIGALKTGHLLPNRPNNRHPQLAVKLAGLEFANPIGMAAGFDKNCQVPDALIKLGFGFAETGTLTPRPQMGKFVVREFFVWQKTMQSSIGWVLTTRAINYAFDRLQKRLASDNNGAIVGINIGANKDSKDFIGDYEMGLKKFWELASYFTINISSPNTPGLRDLQAQKALDEDVEAVGWPWRNFIP